MSELTDWLLEQIAADEAVARAAMEHPDEFLQTGPPWYCDEQSDHVAVAPARVLAECAAKRAIVAEHPLTTHVVPVMSGPTPGYACDRCARLDAIHEDSIVEDQGACNTLRALASVYAGADGWREEWS